MCKVGWVICLELGKTSKAIPCQHYTREQDLISFIISCSSIEFPYSAIFRGPATVGLFSHFGTNPFSLS
jgi:hypothetical protein